MKLSISLPDTIAAEIKQLADQSDRPVSWWIQKAWTVARNQLRFPQQEQRAHRRAMRRLEKLQGSLRPAFPNTSSVSLARKAFRGVD